MSGSASERLIASAFKHSSSAATSSPLGQGRGVGLGQGALKSAATSLCFHGDGGREAALDLVQQIMQMQVRPSSQSTAAPSPSLPSAPSSSSSRMSMSPPPLPRPQHQYHHLHQQQQPPFPLLAEYLASHSTLLGQTDQVTVQFSGGEQRVNGYHRSASLLSNSQAVLPLLQRSASKAEVRPPATFTSPSPSPNSNSNSDGVRTCSSGGPTCTSTRATAWSWTTSWRPSALWGPSSTTTAPSSPLSPSPSPRYQAVSPDHLINGAISL